MMTVTGGAIYPRHIDLEAMSRRHSGKFVKLLRGALLMSNFAYSGLARAPTVRVYLGSGHGRNKDDGLSKPLRQCFEVRKFVWFRN